MRWAHGSGLRALLASVVALALLPMASCVAKPGAARSETNLGADDSLTRLRFTTVRSMLEDSKGRLWFGSWNEGVCRFDGTTLTYLTVEDGLSDNQIRSIQEDRNGIIWFEGGVGISGFDGKDFITPTIRNDLSVHAGTPGASPLWFKADSANIDPALEVQPGAYQYDGATFSYRAYRVPANGSEPGAYATTCIAQGRNGRVWFATYAAVFGFDGESMQVLDEASLGLRENEGRLHVRCVLEDSKGRLWIGSNGIGVLLREGQSTIQFTQEHGFGRQGPHGGRTVPLPGDAAVGAPSLHRVFSIGEDRAGNIWFGTVDHGAWRYDGKSLRNYAAKDGLTSKDIMCIYTDRQGDLWVAGNGVFKFNGVSFDRVH